MKKQFLFMAIGFGLLFWFIDSLLDYLVFHTRDSFMGSFILDLSSHQIYARLSVVVIFIIFGTVVAIILGQQELAQTFLRKNQQRLVVGQTIAHLGDWEWDVQKQRLTWSDEIYRILGVSQEFAPSAEAFEQAIHPEDRDDFLRHREEVLTKKKGSVIDHRIVWPDGDVRYVQERMQVLVDDNGVATKVIGTVQDITERVLADKALRESVAKFRSIVENSQPIIFLIDREGYFILSKGQHLAALGLVPDQVVGLSVMDVYADYPQILAAVEATWRGETIHDPDLMIRNQNGEEVHFDIFYSPQRNANGEITGTVGMAVDTTQRHQMEQVLAEREKQFRQLTENIQEVYWLRNINPSQMLYVSPVYETVWGRPSQSLIDHPESFIETVHPDDVPRMQTAIQQQRNGRYLNEEFRIVRPDGDVRWIQMRDFPVKNQAGDVYRIAGVALDITAQKQVQARLKQLSTAVEQSPVSIIITNLDGTIEYINPKFTQVTGYTINEVAGDTPRILKSGHTNPSEYENLWNTILAGKEWRGEFHNKRKDGTFFWELASISPITNDAGEVTHFLGVKEDITSLKATEESLSLRNQELTSLYRAAHALTSTLDLDRLLSILLEEIRNLLNIVAGSVWLVDETTNTIVCHQATEPHQDIILNWTLAMDEGLIGWSIAHNEHLIVPDVTKDLRHYKEIDAQTGLDLHSILTVPLCVQERVIGALQLVDIEVDRFETHDLMLAESLAAIAAHAIENALLFTNLQNTQQQLVENEKLSVLGQMAATVAHELRNPLMAVRMGVDYITRDLDEDDPRQLGAQLMRTNMHRIDAIVEDILFVVRKPKLGKSYILLQPFLEAEIMRWKVPLAERNFSLTLQCDPDLKPIDVDSDLISRAIGNLISNSAEFLPSEGMIKIALRGFDQNQTLIVEDNGPGISEEHLDHIFDPFFTTRSRGTGLGLSIVKQIIEMHDGKIEVWSEIDQGTKFTITLPSL